MSLDEAHLARPLEIETSDLDTNKYNYSTIVEMRRLFPSQDDLTLARFLVARNNDVVKATDLLTRHLQWRKNNWPILKEEVEEEAKKARIHVQGVDKEGHPILVFNLKNHDANNRDMEALMRMTAWWTELAIAKMRPDICKVTVIMNRVDFTSENSDVEFVKEIIKMFSDNYPERLKYLLVYPTGLFFYGVWSIVKVFLDPVTQAKIKPVVYLSGVQEFIDDAYIPRNMVR